MLISYEDSSLTLTDAEVLEKLQGKYDHERILGCPALLIVLQRHSRQLAAC